MIRGCIFYEPPSRGQNNKTENLSDWSIKELEADAGADEGAKCEDHPEVHGTKFENHLAVYGTKCKYYTEDTPEEQKSVSSRWLAVIW